MIHFNHFKFFIDPLQPLQVFYWPTSTTSSFSVTHFNHFKFFNDPLQPLQVFQCHFKFFIDPLQPLQVFQCHFKFFLTHFNHFKFFIDPLQPLQVFQWPTSTTSSFSVPLQVFYWPTSTTSSFKHLEPHFCTTSTIFWVLFININDLEQENFENSTFWKTHFNHIST